MMLHEANERLKNLQMTGEELDLINSLYILLDLDKDDFCKIIDSVGIDVFLKRRERYDRLIIADDELTAKERYLESVARLEDLKAEMDELNAIVNGYVFHQKVSLDL